MTETKILAIEILRHPQTVNGWRIIAVFSCQARGLELHGCALALGGDEHFTTAWPPRLEAKGIKNHKVTFRDRELRGEIAAAALNAFHALGGTMPERIER